MEEGETVPLSSNCKEYRHHEEQARRDRDHRWNDGSHRDGRGARGNHRVSRRCLEALKPTMNRDTRFEATVMPQLDAAYNLARWITRKPHDADDVVQEAMLRA